MLWYHRPGIALLTVALAADAVLFSFLVILATVAVRNVVSRSVALDILHHISCVAVHTCYKVNFII